MKHVFAHFPNKNYWITATQLDGSFGFSPIPKCGLTLLSKGGHAFLRVFGDEHRVAVKPSRSRIIVDLAPQGMLLRPRPRKNSTNAVQGFAYRV
jgi:hypothetical protein